jgi:uncharacterized protein
LVTTPEPDCWLHPDIEIRDSPIQGRGLFAARDIAAEDVHLILPPRRPNGYGNHSCGPNVWWIDAYSQAARRDIEAGEELTNDYATSTGIADFRMDCACGSELCRGEITGLDWQRADLQERYGEHWTPGLLDLIRRRR